MNQAITPFEQIRRTNEVGDKFCSSRYFASVEDRVRGTRGRSPESPRCASSACSVFSHL